MAASIAAMPRGPLIMLFLTVIAVGWIADDLSVDGPGEALRHNPAALEKAQGAQHAASNSWLSGETVLQRERDGHFYANVAVNAHSARFLVDTGATMIALTGADAMAMGLTWSDADLIPVGRGASGDVFGVPRRLDRVELGGVEARDVEAVIVPYGLDVSLLGQSFLSRIGDVRIEDDRMVLN